MANLGQNFNANNVAPAQTMDILPAGSYKAQIVNSEMKTTRDGNGQFLWLELAVVDGQYANRRIFDRLNLVNNNPQAVEIANRTLSSICHATGQIEVSDSEVLHFKPMRVKVAVRPAGLDKSGVMRDAQNEVKGYDAAGGQTSAPAYVAPAAQAAATSRPAAPAWQRK